MIFFTKLVNSIYPVNVSLQNSEYLKYSIQFKLHREYFLLILCFGAWKEDPRHVPCIILKW